MVTSSKFTRENMDGKAGTRDHGSENRFGLQACDHFALPTNDMDGLFQFLVEVLGGEPWLVAGYSEEDRAINRPKHAFLRVGDVLLQFAEPADGKVKVGRDDLNAWPHWAFRVTADGLLANVDRIRSLGIPVLGPVIHPGAEDAVSAYFTTPEGHKLELTCYGAFPKEKIVGIVGPPPPVGIGYIDWSGLYHDWPNVEPGN
jgi:hypothetical protein